MCVFESWSGSSLTGLFDETESGRLLSELSVLQLDSSASERDASSCFSTLACGRKVGVMNLRKGETSDVLQDDISMPRSSSTVARSCMEHTSPLMTMFGISNVDVVPKM